MGPDVSAALAEVPTVRDTVADIWQRTLSVPADSDLRLLDVLSNAGGMARSQQLGFLLSDIAAATGVSLPPTVVYASPTKSELATMVQQRDWPQYQRPVLMQNGDGPPLFVFPGIGGIGLDTITLVRNLRFAGPIYLNPPRGVDGAPPHTTLPEVVDDHIAIIRAVQPTGPYWLLGYSWGGLIAMEVARRLRAHSEIVAFLGIIDPVLNQVDWTYGAWIEFMVSRVRHHARELRHIRSPAAAIRYCGDKIVPVVDKVARLFGYNKLWPLASNAEKLPPALGAIWSAESAIIPSYRMQFYDGPVTLFATRDGHAGECDPARVWPSKVSRLDLQWVPGDHLLTEPSVRDIAAMISARLKVVSDSALNA